MSINHTEFQRPGTKKKKEKKKEKPQNQNVKHLIKKFYTILITYWNDNVLNILS